MSVWNVTEARANLPRILQLVEDGEEVTLQRHGRDVAVIVRPDALRLRRGAVALQVGEEIAGLLRGLAAEDTPTGHLSAERGEAQLAEIRADRDRE